MTKIDSEVGAQSRVMEWVPHKPPAITEGDIIYASMLYPNDKVMFQSHLMSASMSRQIKSSGTWKMEPFWHNLSATKVDDVRLLKSETEAAKKGLLAGWMFAALYIMAREIHIEEPSKAKAAHVVSEFAKGKVWKDSSKGIAATRNYISKVFAEKSSVLHFWAAYVLNNKNSYPFAREESIFGDHLERFLRVSKGLQDFGLTYTSDRNKDDSPPISGSSMWLLDDVIEPYELPLRGSPDSIYSYLSSYKVN